MRLLRNTLHLTAVLFAILLVIGLWCLGVVGGVWLMANGLWFLGVPLAVFSMAAFIVVADEYA